MRRVKTAQEAWQRAQAQQRAQAEVGAVINMMDNCYDKTSTMPTISHPPFFPTAARCWTGHC